MSIEHLFEGRPNYSKILARLAQLEYLPTENDRHVHYILLAFYIALQEEGKAPIYLQHIPEDVKRRVITRLKASGVFFEVSEQQIKSNELYRHYLQACDALESYGRPGYASLFLLAEILAILAIITAISAFLIGHYALLTGPYLVYAIPFFLLNIGLIILSKYRAPYQATRNFILLLQDKKQRNVYAHTAAFTLSLAIGVFSAAGIYNTFITLGTLGLFSASTALLIAQIVAIIVLINSFIGLYETIYNVKVNHSNLCYVLISRALLGTPSREKEESTLSKWIPKPVLDNLSLWNKISDPILSGGAWIWDVCPKLKGIPLHIYALGLIHSFSPLTLIHFFSKPIKEVVSFEPPASLSDLFKFHNKVCGYLNGPISIHRTLQCIHTPIVPVG